MSDKKLFRPGQGRMVAGVALAFANYFNIDVTLVRILFVLFALMGGPGLLLYVVCWIIIPTEQ